MRQENVGIRQQLITLLEANQWLMTDRAEQEGRQVLRALMPFPTQFAIVDFILDRLKEGYPFHPVGLGEPPGSMGTGYVMNFTDAKVSNLYIKLTISEGKVLVLSFHNSKHCKGK